MIFRKGLEILANPASLTKTHKTYSGNPIENIIWPLGPSNRCDYFLELFLAEQLLTLNSNVACSFVSIKPPSWMSCTLYPRKQVCYYHCTSSHKPTRFKPAI